MIRPALVFCLLLAAGPVFGGGGLRTDADVMAEVAFSPPLNARVPALRFAGGEGPVALRELLARRPSLLTFAWFDCGNLCGLVVNGLADSSGDLIRDGRDDFQVVVVSLDANTDPDRARRERRELEKRYPGAGIAEHWSILTGSAGAIRRLADAVGYRFVYDPRKAQYAHPAGVVAVSRDGHIRDFRSGVNYRREDIADMVAAAAAPAPAPAKPNPVLLLCYDYDPSSGRYSLAIMKLLRLTAAAAILLLVGVVIYWQKKGRRGDS